MTLGYAKPSRQNTKNISYRRKIKVDLIIIKNFCASNDTSKKQKVCPTEGKKVFTYHISNKGLVSQMFKELLRLDNKKINNQLNGQRTRVIDISQSRCKNDQQVCEKMCISISHPRMQIKNTRKYYFILSRMATIQMTDNNKRW